MDRTDAFCETLADASKAHGYDVAYTTDAHGAPRLGLAEGESKMSEQPAILIVDDDVSFCETLADTLQISGFQTDSVGALEEALSKIEGRFFNVVLLDLKLPDTTGLEALRAIKERAPETEVVVVTGYASVPSVIEAINGQAFSYVEKPIDIQHLLWVINRILEEQTLRARTTELMGRLRESEERYRHLFENLNDAAFLADRETGLIIETNKAGEELTGRTRDEIIGMHQTQLHPPEKVEQYRQRFAEHVEKGRMADFDGEVMRKDGSIVSVAISASIVTLAGKEYLLGLFRDITDRKEAEQATARAMERARKYFDVAGVMLLVIGADETVQLINRRGCEVLGYSRDEVIGKNWFDVFIPEAFRAEARELFSKLMMAGDEGIEHHEGTVLTKTGEQRDIAWNYSVLWDQDGNVEGILCSGEHITERQRLERQLRQAQKMEAVGRLAGGIAHDFNNLLTVITGYSQLLLMKLPEADPSRHDVEEIEKAARRAASLTQQLLAFSRRQVLNPKVLRLNDVVADVEDMLRRTIGEDIEFVTVLDPDLGLVEVDPGQFSQIIMNLTINARDAMPEGGKLIIETQNVTLDESYTQTHPAVVPGDYVMLAISDTGRGMDEETLSHIFEPFFTTKKKGEGTGLGLSTVYGIVKQSGGYVWAYSEPGEGTTFKVYLPRVQKPASMKKQGTKGTELPHGTETILLVEDEEVVRGLAYRVLSESGYTVLQASDGATALQILKEHGDAVRLLVTDVVMPGMSGHDLAEQVQTQYPHIKVLFTSGYTNNTIMQRGILRKGVQLLSKPFTPNELSRKVRE
ncbi:MAG: PAS domain S-box protein, partial [Armatimonadetes bacterium]|nr:PAS domain S-box protein [Armatimonadota bacterium]